MSHQEIETETKIEIEILAGCKMGKNNVAMIELERLGFILY